MASAPPAQRSQIGHFRLLEKIGAGAMGEVYRAHDEHLQREVAIKLLPSGALHDSSERARFRREALALSKLNHPNIATIHDFDSDGELDFLVMEFVPGMGLREKISAGALPEPEAVRLASELAEAMAAAHQHGVIHRDLKPENLRVAADGRLKVLDFGVAKLVPPKTPSGVPTPAAPLASTTELETFLLQEGIAGTVPYMAPEQLKNEEVDERCDIWAAGVLLYEMTTGRRPFAAAGLALATSILQDAAVPPRQLRPQLSPALEAVILKCLEKEPARRYQSARELLAALDTLRRPLPPAPAKIVPRRRLWYAGITALGLCLLVAAVFLFRHFRRQSAESLPTIRSLAVLPLANLSGKPDQDYLADGMTEELITDLAHIGALKVVSRTSCMRYKNSGKAVPEIARELGVDAVIEGSVLRVGNRVRVTAQLLHGPTDRHLWAGSYDRDFKDVLALQGELAERIAQEIRLRLSADARNRLRQRREVSPESYELWLRGNYLLDKPNEASFRKAIELYSRASEIDPSFAPAHATLAFAHLSTTTWNYAAPAQPCADAEREARQALALDDQLAEGHTALADVLFYCQWNWPEAEREIKTAIDLSPNYVGAHYDYAFFLALMRRSDDAVREIQLARSLDPVSPRIRHSVGYIYYYARRYEEAVPHFQAALEMEPSLLLAHTMLAMIYARQGNAEAAFRERLAALAATTDPRYVADLRAAFAQGGLRAVAQLRLQRALQRSRETFVPPTTIASLYLESGNPEQCLTWLEKAYALRDVQLLDINADPRFESLGEKPRFQQLVRRLGFSAPAGGHLQSDTARN
jgi:serine/threonine-protein kinase